MWIRMLYFSWCNLGSVYLACNCFSCIYLLVRLLARTCIYTHGAASLHALPLQQGYFIWHNVYKSGGTGEKELCWRYAGGLFFLQIKHIREKPRDYSEAFFLRVYTGAWFDDNRSS